MGCTHRIDELIRSFPENVNLQVVSLQVQVENWSLVSLRKEYFVLGTDTSYSSNILACLTLSFQ